MDHPVESTDSIVDRVRATSDMQERVDRGESRLVVSTQALVQPQPTSSPSGVMALPLISPAMKERPPLGAGVTLFASCAKNATRAQIFQLNTPSS